MHQSGPFKSFFCVNMTNRSIYIIISFYHFESKLQHHYKYFRQENCSSWCFNFLQGFVVYEGIKELTDKSFTIFPIAASRAFPAGLGKTRELAIEVHSSPMTDLERRGDNWRWSQWPFRNSPARFPHKHFRFRCHMTPRGWTPLLEMGMNRSSLQKKKIKYDF